MGQILIFFKLKKSVIAYFSYFQMKDKCNSSTKAWGFSVSEPHLKGAVLWCWEHLRAITSPFTTCAKVVRRDNEVLASNDSLEHCSISYVKQKGPGYWLYWRACVSFWKLIFYLNAEVKEKKLVGDALSSPLSLISGQSTPRVVWMEKRANIFPLHSDLVTHNKDTGQPRSLQVDTGWSWDLKKTL